MLDEELLALLGLQEDGDVQVTLRDGSLVVTPVRPRSVDRIEERRQRVNDGLDSDTERYGSAFLWLAE